MKNASSLSLPPSLPFPFLPFPSLVYVCVNVHSHYRYGKLGKYPLDHLDDCEASKYFLQLNMYRHILQKHYNIVVSSMTLTSFHPQASTYFCTDVPFWDTEVEKVLEDLAQRNEAAAAESDETM
jgi:hypothetical protein